MKAFTKVLNSMRSTLSFSWRWRSRQRPLSFNEDERVTVPCGVARFPLEAPFPPREWVERGYAVTHWSEMSRGGHFAAMEEPHLLAEDIRSFFRTLR